MPERSSNWEQVYNIIQSITYIILGIVGIVISVGSLIGWDILGSFIEDPHNQILSFIYIILASVSILMLLLGLERRTWLEKNYQKIEDVYNQLDLIGKELTFLNNAAKRYVGTKYLINAKEVYDTTGRLMATANQHIRVVNTIITGPKTPKELIYNIANILKVRKDIGSPIRYDVVIALDVNNIPVNFTREMIERTKVYEEKDVLDCYSLYILETNPTTIFDVLIIDSQHFGIGLTRHERESNLNGALSLENQPEIASQFATWFDRVIIPSAVPFEKWARKHGVSSTNDLIDK